MLEAHAPRPERPRTLPGGLDRGRPRDYAALNFERDKRAGKLAPDGGRAVSPLSSPPRIYDMAQAGTASCRTLEAVIMRR